MHIKSGLLGEDAEPKLETQMLKSLDDPYMKENRKNSFQETEGTLGMAEANGPSVFCGRKKVWVGAVILMVVLAGIGAGVSLASASHILHELGFTSKGVASKSFASRLMSSTSQANNHTVPKDSWVSWLQRAGQRGLTAEHQAYFGSGGAIAGIAVAVMVVLVALVVAVTLRRCRQQKSS